MADIIWWEDDNPTAIDVTSCEPSIYSYIIQRERLVATSLLQNEEKSLSARLVIHSLMRMAQ